MTPNAVHLAVHWFAQTYQSEPVVLHSDTLVPDVLDGRGRRQLMESCAIEDDEEVKRDLKTGKHRVVTTATAMVVVVLELHD